MIRNQFLSAALSAMGLMFAAPAATANPPLVKINDGQQNACTVTPSTGTVFTLSTTGDVLINGTYSPGCGGSTGGGGPTDPTFSPFSPPAADLTIPGSFPLGSSGGSVTPAFVAYYANSCTGSVTPSASCTAVTGAWAGGTVCSGTTNTAGQTYCSPSAAVSIPTNSTSAGCTYAFKATCTGTKTIVSQTVNVTVSAGGGGPPPPGCVDGSPSGDLGTYGYTRQCTGPLTDQNKSLSPHWTTSTITDLLSADWPGVTAQLSFALMLTVKQNSFASFSFNSGSAGAGLTFTPNVSYGMSPTLSVSDVPGDVFAGTSYCHGSTISVSSKAGTTSTCKLQPNKTYYLNISAADAISDGHASACLSTSCVIAVAPYPNPN